MEKDTLFQARDLPPDKRKAVEVLLGQRLDGDEIVMVRTAKGQLLKEGLSGEARDVAVEQLFELLDQTAKRTEGLPDEEIDAAIHEATDYVRHDRG